MSVSEKGSRVVVAMSGGVDSSVAAARLVSRGFDVVGVTLHLWDYPDDGSTRGRCCAPEDVHDARRVCDTLGIPHYAFDRRRDFASTVVAPFVEGYLAGETPSPCVACNRGVKMRELFALADTLGAARVATGHYARIVREQGRAWLAMAHDLTKDQSYFLHALTQHELERLVFPLADATKAEARAEAHQLALPGANKGESQEICFVPTGRYDAFVRERAADGRVRPGPIIDGTGREVGRHNGVHSFTVGQRKGLGIALGEPAFVVDIDAASATVRVGPVEGLDAVGVETDDAIFAPELPAHFAARVKVRARHEGVPAQITRDEQGHFTVRFDAPTRAVSVGQYVVAYVDDRVVGGARIARVLRAAAS